MKYKLRQQGFTIIELVIVIVLLAIVAINVTPRWSANAINLGHETKRVLNDIRYAQAMALLTGKRYQWVRTSSNTYQITNASGAAILLGNGQTTLTLNGNITFSSLSNLPNNLLSFDAQGAPYINTILPGTALASTAVITLQSGSLSQNIQILSQTGFGS